MNQAANYSCKEDHYDSDHFWGQKKVWNNQLKGKTWGKSKYVYKHSPALKVKSWHSLRRDGEKAGKCYTQTTCPSPNFAYCWK